MCVSVFISFMSRREYMHDEMCCRHVLSLPLSVCIYEYMCVTYVLQLIHPITAHKGCVLGIHTPDKNDMKENGGGEGV